MQNSTKNNLTGKFNFFMKALMITTMVGLSLFSGKVEAQANVYTYAATTANSLETIVLPTVVTTTTTGSLDDGSIVITPASFSFNYVGTTYSSFLAGTNGYVLFGNAVPGTLIPSSLATHAGFAGAYAFGRDGNLNVPNGGNLTHGAAAGGKYVFQFTNHSGGSSGGESTTILATFQIVLWGSASATPGKIEIIYGTSAGTPGSSGTIGIRDAANMVLNGVNGTTSATGTAAAFPVSGTKYAFNPPPLCVTPASQPTGLSFGTPTFSSVTGSFTAAAGTPSGYLVVRYPSAATPVNPVAGTIYTPNAALGTGTIVVTGATTTFTAVNLAASNTYDFYVYAYNNTVCSGGPIYNTAAPLTGSISTPSGTLSGIKTVGNGGDYTNLTLAFADINSNGLSGNIELQLISGYPFVGETYPITGPVAAAGGGYTIKVYPTVSGLSITSTNTTGTLNLNNSAKLLIDGRVNQTGAVDLIIGNSNPGASYAVQFINDANNNTIQYCNLQSRNTSTTSGTIVFNTTTGTNGNDANTISFCNIKDEVLSGPLNAIYASGTTTSTAQYNDNNTISNNNIYNFFSPATATNGMLINTGNNAWTISGNSIYQTVSRTYTTGATHTGINIASTTAGNNFNISNNFIGGTAPNAGGTAYTMQGTVATLFRGISLGTATATASNVQGNTISNIALTTSSGSATLPGVFSGINISAGLVNVGTVTANVIGAATGNNAIVVTSTTTGGIITGIYGTSGAALNIQNNNIGAIGTNSAATIGHLIYGINIGGAGSHTISLNNIGSSTTANSIATGTNAVTTATSSVFGILSAGSGTTQNINSNNIYNLRGNSSGTSSQISGVQYTGSASGAALNINSNVVRNNSFVSGVFTGIYDNNGASSATLIATINLNKVYANTALGTGTTTIYGIRGSTDTYTMDNNQLYDLSITANTAAVTSAIYGIYNLASPTNETITNNVINNFSIAGSSTSGSHVIAGMNFNTTAGTRINSGNIINGFNFTNTSTGSATLYGINSITSSPTIFKNKIYDLVATNGAASVVYGIYLSTAATALVYNNLVGNLSAPASGLTAPAPSVVGLYINSGTTINAYYNTINISGTGGTNFGTAAVYATATATTINLRNNIFSNNALANGTGRTVAYQRATTTLTNYAATSNNNLFYAGTPGAANLVYFDGTNADQTIAAYKSRMATRDQASVSQNPDFLSTIGANSNFLHINTATPTLIESGAAAIATFATDYDGDTRNATTPDIGADEFTGTAPVTVIINSLSITPTGNQCTTAIRTVTANITAGSTDLLSVTLNYSFNGAAPVSVAMTGGTLTAGSTSNFTANIPASTPANAIVSWSVTAIDGVTSKASVGTGYTDEPLANITATITATPNPICSGAPAQLAATLNGFSSTYCTPTIPNTSSPGATGDYLKDFTFADITNNGTPDATSDYTYYSALTAHVVANGSTPYNISLGAGGTGSITAQVFRAWIDYNQNGVFEPAESVFFTSLPTYIGGGAPSTGTITIPTSAYNGTTRMRVVSKYTSSSSVVIVADNQSCGLTSSDYGEYEDYNVSVTGGTNNPNLPAFSWSDGTTVVGTTNPVTVNPAVNTNYTLTITSLNGCSKSFAPVAVTTTALPPAPNVNNSSQCGDHVPDAFVSTTFDGVTNISTGAFKWYSAQTGGTLLQTGGATYTGSISTTTHLWVSESNGTCESVRSDVLVTVTTSDAIQASVDNNSPCANSIINLSVANIQAVPNNTYTYAWTSTPGSGMTGSIAGSTLQVTPTAPGTYIYTVTATDGSCTNTATVTVTVKDLPVITSVTANPATAVCAGAPVSLTARSIQSTPGNITIGAGALTTTNSGNSGTTYNSPFSHYYGGYKAEYLIRASELTAAGLAPGNINSLSFDVTTAGTTYNGFVMSLAATAATVTGTTFTSTGLTQVFSGNLAVTTTGIKTLAFSTPFVWNGTSNIIVQFYWSNNNGGGTAAEVKYDNTAYVSATQYHVDSQTPAAVAAVTGTAVVLGNGAGGVLSQRPKMVFAGQLGAEVTATLNWAWNPGALTGSTVSVSPLNTTVYTVTATNPTTTCSNTATLTVSVNPLPPAPSTNNGTDQCGTGITDASVSSNSTETTPIFKWYAAPTGGTALQTGTSATYLTAISATTTFYVSEVSSFGCEGPRAAVTTVVSDPDPIVVTSTQSNICAGSSIDLTVNYTPNFNSFATFTLTASPEAGSGITNPVNLDLNGNGDGTAAFSLTPAAAGTYIYSVTAVDPDKGCTTVSTVTVTVNAVPQITAATATPSVVCAGTSVVLSALSAPATPGSATIGAGASTSSSAGTPFYGGWGGTKVQYIYTKAELAAAGIAPGNITALALNITAAGGTAYGGFAISIGTTTQTAFATPDAVTSVVQVYNGPLANAGYMATVGLNTFTFTNPFNWNGTDNIVVSICYSNATTSNPASTVQTDTYAGNQTFYIYADSQTASTVCGATTTIPASGGSSTSNVRPRTTFTGQVGPNLTANYSWTWNPGALSGSTVTVAPLVTTTYTATASALGCSSNSAGVTVTVNPLPAAPSTNSPVTRCGPGSVTLTATGSGGSLNWYNVATGGTSLQTGGSFTTSVTASTAFWVDETSAAGCIGPRTQVTVSVTAPPALTIVPSGPVAFCQGGNVVLTAGGDPSYNSFTWSVSPLAGSGLSSTTGSPVTATPTIAGVYIYTLNATDGLAQGCANTTTITVTVNPNPVISNVTATKSTVCAGGASTLTASSIGVTSFNVGEVSGTIFSSLSDYSMYFGTTSAATINTVDIYPSVAGTLTVELYDDNSDLVATRTFTIAAGDISTTVKKTLALNFNIPAGSSGWEIYYTGLAINRGEGSYSYPYTSNGFSITGNSIDGDDITGGSRFYFYNWNVSNNIDNSNTLNWVWNPGALTGNSITVNPVATTTYTVTATVPSTGCVSTASTITVTVTPVGATATATPSVPVCAGTSVTLNSGATGGSPFTYAWASTPAGSYPATASISVNPTVTTSYTVTVTDNCGNPTTSTVTVNVNPLPTAAIAEAGPITLCFPSTQVLTAVTNVATASYQWTLNGVNIPAATGATYTINTASTGTYRVIVTNTVTNCVSAASAGVVVTINAQPAAVTITPATATICNGGSQSLVASGGTTGGAANAVIGTGTTLTSLTAQPTAFCNRWPSSRMQTLFTAAELSTAGLSAGSTINSMAFTITSNGDGTTNPGFTVKIAPSALTVLSGDFVSTASGFTTVYPAATYTHAVGVNVIPFSTSFTWNGTSNLIVEVLQNGADAINNSETYYTTTATDMVAYTTTAASNAASFSTQRLNVSFGYSSLQTPTWSWSPAGSLNTATGATVIASPSATTTYTATATNSFGCTNSSTATVTVNPRPTGTISGTGVFCQNAPNTSTNLTLTFSGTAPWSYTYTDGTTPVSGTASSSPHTIVVSPSSAAAGLITYTLTALSDAVCASIAADLTGSGTVTINPLAATPTATVTQPTCGTATGTITVTAPLGTGNSYTLDGTTTISWPAIAFSAVAPGVHTITVSNSFGCSAPASASVTVDAQPITPAAPTVTGTVNVCPYLGTAEQITYTATAAGATTYTWTLPPNVNLISGGTGTDHVTVTFNTGFSTQPNKQIRVTAGSTCGTSAMTIYYLLTQFPVTPNPISGPTNVCTLIGTSTAATYTITPSVGAVTYVWTAPAGATVTHPNAPGVNDLTINVTFDNSFAGGPISVTAVNGCGTSGTRTLNIINSPASVPGLISGPTNVCGNIAPTGTAATYAVTAVASANSYTWTAPAGAIVTHPNGSGVNDYTITVLYPAGFTSGTITVTATNGCGTSAARSLTVTKLNPATPGNIDVIQTHVCGEAGGRVFTYSVSAIPANATSVQWTIPATGATLVSGQGTASITVAYLDVAITGTVTAQAVNNCGASTTRTATVRLPACPPPSFTGVTSAANSSGQTKNTTATANSQLLEVKIFPNPTVSDFKLEVLTSAKAQIHVRILDGTGRLYKTFTVQPYEVIALGAELKTGAYLVEVRQGETVKTTKVIKF